MYVCICMYIYIYIYIHVCVCIYIYIYIYYVLYMYMYIYIYMFINTDSALRKPIVPSAQESLFFGGVTFHTLSHMTIWTISYMLLNMLYIYFQCVYTYIYIYIYIQYPFLYIKYKHYGQRYDKLYSHPYDHTICIIHVLDNYASSTHTHTGDYYSHCLH